jgi:hypothetical protein
MIADVNIGQKDPMNIGPKMFLLKLTEHNQLNILHSCSEELGYLSHYSVCLQTGQLGFDP